MKEQTNLPRSDQRKLQSRNRKSSVWKARKVSKGSALKKKAKQTSLEALWCVVRVARSPVWLKVG